MDFNTAIETGGFNRLFQTAYRPFAMSRLQQFRLNSYCAFRGFITLRWQRIPFYLAGLFRALRGP